MAELVYASDSKSDEIYLLRVRVSPPAPMRPTCFSSESFQELSVILIHFLYHNIMNILDAVVFYTNDIDKIIDFYTYQIGLELEYRSGDKYASFLFDNGVRLGIKKAAEKREIPGSQTFFLSVKNAKIEYKNAQKKGLKIYKELIEETWALEFSVLDPDGNKIEFVQNK